jgi:hypothetical protein
MGVGEIVDQNRVLAGVAIHGDDRDGACCGVRNKAGARMIVDM